MIAAKKLGIEFHIVGNWTGYRDSVEIEEDEKKYGIKIFQIDFIRNPFDPRNIKAYSQVIKLIKKENYDLIHCNTPIGGVIGRLAGKKCGVNKIIYQAHGFHFFTGAPLLNWIIYYPVERILAHLTHALITINTEDYELAKKFRLKENGNVYYVPGVGIDLYNVEPAEAQDCKNLRQKLGIKDSDFVLISVGELNKNKNNRIIIEAMNELNNQNIHYLVCGDGSAREDLQNLAEKYNLARNVHFLGYRNDIEELLNISDVFVMPSIREGLSRSIMEAMAVGKPCIVSDIRGNRDLISNETGGYLCGSTDVKMFAEAIRNLANNDRLVREMGKYNLKMIKLYDINVVAEKLESIYKETIDYYS
jgi:glycosyltransferase involved in cell wall biosynthesis